MSRPVAACAAAFAIALGGCGGKVIDDERAEQSIEDDFERSVGIRASSVDCPTDVDVTTGDTFECRVETQRGTATVTLEILNEDADVRVVDLKQGG
jgi:Domain of unknown function (DUF4333)